MNDIFQGIKAKWNQTVTSITTVRKLKSAVNFYNIFLLLKRKSFQLPPLKFKLRGLVKTRQVLIDRGGSTFPKTFVLAR